MLALQPAPWPSHPTAAASTEKRQTHLAAAHSASTTAWLGVLQRSTPSRFICTPPGLLTSDHLWPHDVDWTQLPPRTHVLLYGTSHMYEMSSVLRSGLAHLGQLERTDVISDASACADPATASLPDWGRPRSSISGADYLAGRCTPGRAAQTCGVKQRPCENQQGLVVDYIAGNSTITTISNFGLVQRSASYLERLLSHLPHRITHAAVMRPHSEAYFDAQCVRERGGPMPDANLVGDKVEPCDAYAHASCTHRHSAYQLIAKLLPPERVATVLRPEMGPLGLGPGFKRPERYQTLRRLAAREIGVTCVTDDQLAEPGCDRHHNTTAWLTQAYLLLEDVRAGESMAKASHLCALICGRDDLYSCAQGPGVAAAWLVMRTMGLARPPHAGGGTRSGRAGTRVSSTSR